MNEERMAQCISEELDQLGSEDGPVRLAVIHEDGGVEPTTGAAIGTYLAPLLLAAIEAEASGLDRPSDGLRAALDEAIRVIVGAGNGTTTRSRPVEEWQRLYRLLSEARVALGATGEGSDRYESPVPFVAMGLLHSGREHEADANSRCASCRNLALATGEGSGTA